MRGLLSAVVLAVPLVACASAFDVQHALQRQTALAITPTPYPDSVTVTDVRRDRLGNAHTWVASTRTGVYDCSIEQGERRALCAKRDAAH